VVPPHSRTSQNHHQISLYQAFQGISDLMAPARLVAGLAGEVLQSGLL